MTLDYGPKARTTLVLGLTLAAVLAGGGSAHAARDEPSAAEADTHYAKMTVLDAGAHAAIKAKLEARTQTIVVTRFSVAPGASSSRKGLSTQGCPTTPAPDAVPSADAAPAPALDPKVLDKLSAQITKRLARRAPVAPQTTAGAAPMGALIVTGCITLFEAGDPAKRMVGMNMGASRLAAHVRVSQKLRKGLKPIGDMDVSVHGANLLPPLSPLSVVTRVALMSRQTLEADAGKLGNRIAEAVQRGFGVDEE